MARRWQPPHPSTSPPRPPTVCPVTGTKPFASRAAAARFLAELAGNMPHRLIPGWCPACAGWHPAGANTPAPMAIEPPPADPGPVPQTVTVHVAGGLL